MNKDNLLIMLESLRASGRYSALRKGLCEMNVVDTAELLETLGTEDLLRVFRILPKDVSTDVFSYFDAETKARLVGAITDSELEALVNDLFLDDAVDFLEELPANIVKRVIARAEPETRTMINRFLQYPEFSAGSIMTIEMVELRDDLTVGEAIEHIRRTGVDKETIYTAYCIDASRHLIGSVALRQLILSDTQTPVSDLMCAKDKLISVNTHDDQEVVADLVRKYDLLSVPVTDSEGRLVGIITIDDIVDVIEDENTEDFEKMALLIPSEYEYLKTGIFRLAGNRLVWLLVLMVSATFTGKIIEGFEGMLTAVVGLTAAIPMLMDTGGNAGSQVSTLIIRGMALGEVRARDWFRILFKELRVGLLCGAVLAIVNLLRMWLFSSADLKIYFVVSAALICTLVISKLFGCSLPIIAKFLRIDPALMAGPMLTTFVDTISLLIYFSLARAFLL